MSQVPLPMPERQLLQLTLSELELQLVSRDIQWTEHARTLLRQVQSAEDAQAQSKSFELELNEFRVELLLTKIALERQVTTELQLELQQMKQKVREEWEIMIQAEEFIETLKKQRELKIEMVLLKLKSLKLKSPLE